jgi:peptidoglycan/LPS O-acetylase OafA/YrhL
MATLADLSSRPHNHFNLIRLLAAAAVLVSHSFPLAGGEQADEPLRASLGLTLGEVAVVTFFCISGFFISMSQDRSHGSLDLVAARALRIFPGLICVVLCCALVIGPIFTVLSTSQYFADSHTWSYVLNNITLARMQFTLPGLFESNPFPGINGSLWTLFYEALFYVLVGVAGALGLFGANRRFSVFITAYVVIYVAFRCLQQTSPLVESLGRVDALFKWSLPFVIGMALYRYRRQVQLRGVYALPLFALAALCLNGSGFYEAFVLLWADLTFCLGFSARTLPFRLGGDYSYGLYVWAFPIQEIVAYLLPGIGPWQMMLLAMPAAILVAMASWHWLEKPCMTWRKALVGRLRTQWPTIFAAPKRPL